MTKMAKVGEEGMSRARITQILVDKLYSTSDESCWNILGRGVM